MSKNTGLEYEQLVQKIYDSMLNEGSVERIRVQHNIKLVGKSGTSHQIDVFWEFETAGIRHCVIVQAKDYNLSISQDKLLTFKSVLDDIPSQPRGIFITKTGYQKGAKEFAQHHGIMLYELRKPTDNDWKGKMKNLTIKSQVVSHEVTDFKLNLDAEYFSQYTNSISPDNLGRIFSPIETFLYDIDGTSIMSVQDLLNIYIRKNNLESTVVEHEFSEPTFMKIADDIPRLKIKSISFTLTMHTSIIENIICGENIVAYILKNVLDESVETKRIKSNLEVLK